MSGDKRLLRSITICGYSSSEIACISRSIRKHFAPCPDRCAQISGDKTLHSLFSFGSPHALTQIHVHYSRQPGNASLGDNTQPHTNLRGTSTPFTAYAEIPFQNLLHPCMKKRVTSEKKLCGFSSFPFSRLVQLVDFVRED